MLSYYKFFNFIPFRLEISDKFGVNVSRDVYYTKLITLLHKNLVQVI